MNVKFKNNGKDEYEIGVNPNQELDFVLASEVVEVISKLNKQEKRQLVWDNDILSNIFENSESEGFYHYSKLIECIEREDVDNLLQRIANMSPDSVFLAKELQSVVEKRKENK